MAEVDWVPYPQRSSWSDVTPLPQDDGPNPVVKIAYTERFKEVYDYFRAIVKSGEKSPRVLELTEDALDLNPAHYTVWHYRREVLKAISADLVEELKYCRSMIEDHPKNYQVWEHRRRLIEWSQKPDQELRFVQMILSQDSKNYHAWQHRQWVNKTFGLWEGELEFTDELLEEGIRNNSAWNQRHFVITQTSGWTPEVCTREVDYSLKKIDLVKGNESAWNYLRGVLTDCMSSDTATSLREKVFHKCKELKELEGGDNKEVLGFIVELLKLKLEDAGDNDKGELIEELCALCKDLEERVDTVRRKYWKFIRDKTIAKYGGDD